MVKRLFDRLHELSRNYAYCTMLWLVLLLLAPVTGEMPFLLSWLLKVDFLYCDSSHKGIKIFYFIVMVLFGSQLLRDLYILLDAWT